MTPPYMAKGITPHPQMGLACVGAYLENLGYEVKIVDAMASGWTRSGSTGWDNKYIGLSFEEIKEEIRSFKPQVIGVHNNFTSQHRMPGLVFQAAKEVDEAIVTVTGGAHASVCTELCLQDKNLDFVVIGEGELPFGQLLEHLKGDKPIHEVAGIAYRNNGSTVIVPQREWISDLDRLPFPARHLLDFDLYWRLGFSHGKRPGKRFTPVITSRGCPCNCAFCTYHRVSGKKFRPRSPESVIAELKLLKDKYKVDEITFEDDNLTLDPKRAARIFDMMIAEGLGFRWEVPNGVAAFTLSREIIKKMKDSGCYRINFAIESGSQYVLDNIIRKPLDLEKVPDLVEYCREIGIEPNIFLLIGTPGETKEQMWESFRFAEKIKVYHPFISTCMPLVGSEAYRICEQNNYFDPGFSLDSLNLEYPCFSTPQISSKELYKMKKAGERYLAAKAILAHPFDPHEWISMAAKCLPDPVKRLIVSTVRFLFSRKSV